MPWVNGFMYLPLTGEQRPVDRLDQPKVPLGPIDAARAEGAQMKGKDHDTMDLRTGTYRSTTLDWQFWNVAVY